ncbi:MAG: tetratricopeptide repeat protein [Ilumatobacteraceae bacterium]
MPATAAARRAAEVRARVGGRVYGKKGKAYEPPVRDEETIVDLGPVRERRRGKSQQAERTERPAKDLEPALQKAVTRCVGERRAAAVGAKLSRALECYDAERWGEARRLVAPLLTDLRSIPEVNVLAGRLAYRLGRWDEAAEFLEAGRGDDRSDATNLPVLIDCYRALRRYEKVDQLWEELRLLSPSPDILAEGRVSTAMSYADRGELMTAIRIMTHGTPPARPLPHHLLEWYVLGDLHDRAGDTVTAQRLFQRVAAVDPDYFDVTDRLAELGD